MSHLLVYNMAHWPNLRLSIMSNIKSPRRLLQKKFIIRFYHHSTRSFSRKNVSIFFPIIGVIIGRGGRDHNSNIFPKNDFLLSYYKNLKDCEWHFFCNNLKVDILGKSNHWMMLIQLCLVFTKQTYTQLSMGT